MTPQEEKQEKKEKLVRRSDVETRIVNLSKRIRMHPIPSRLELLNDCEYQSCDHSLSFQGDYEFMQPKTRWNVKLFDRVLHNDDYKNIDEYVSESYVYLRLVT